MRRPLLAALLVISTTQFPFAEARDAGQCPEVVDERRFASAEALRELNAEVAGFGLRSTGSPAHRRLLDWLEQRLRRTPGFTVTSQELRIRRWQPRGGDLASAGSLSAAGRPVAVAGAIPYSLPGSREGVLAHLPRTERITADNARGKVVLRDFPAVDRGHTAEPELDRDLVDAGLAGAAGLVIAFDFPREQVKWYWDPHTGTHYRVPGVFVGVDEAERLKRSVGERVRIAVEAKTDPARTRTLIATLPGQSKERIVLGTNTDGNTWVQENGTVALLALADYFSRLPVRCRPRTLELVLATGHLHRSVEGTEHRARTLDKDYDKGTVAFAMALEHLGTRELVPSPRTNGPGRELRYTGAVEQSAWFAGNPLLIETVKQAIARRTLQRTFVLPGIDRPDPVRVPPQCSFGGLGTHYQSHLIPTIATISGPWSLWAPSFGEGAVDHARMREQVLAAGDTVLALDGVPRDQIAGDYLAHRKARAEGAPTCSHALPPEQAPAR
ncbi:zinc-binding metallopeptidase family protein [Allokutzneria albata]|uniref:PA domain-containing protein n=1 Tax=Allokutzneria albata TaxID=211114 RepID=A0A1G9VQV1_ALLAB|nr:hypothetical protein [Allokutzneria albata]SDM74558.1 hypothetical protein SAMN04489726_3181 [Allokutzneria albata]